MDPTFEARVVRFHQDKAHNNNGYYSGRYDWWIRKIESQKSKNEFILYK